MHRPRRGEWAALAAIVAVAAIAPAFLIFGHEGQPSQKASVSAAETKVPAKAEIRIVAAPPAERYALRPPFEIDDALTFGPEKATRTKLASLDGPTGEAVCFDNGGLPWACGLAARAALQSMIRLGRLDCEPVRLITGVQISRCSNDNGDLGRQMVARGFARPSDGVETPEMTAAREAGLGMWNGGWRLKR